MNKRKLLSYFLQDQAGDAGGAAGGAPNPGAAAAVVAATGEQGAAPSGDKPAPTALEQGAAGSAPAPGAPAGDQPIAIPEKYLVKKEDGTIDQDASSLKLAEAYVNLEKRVGTGDLPPKTPEEYAIAVPEQFKESWKPAEDPLLQEFLKDAHAAGLTQKQVDLVMGKYFEMAPGLVAASRELDAEECTASLKAEWKSDDEYKSNINKAYRAAVGYFGTDAMDIVKEYGNDPRIIKGLAKLGAEMGEDKSINFEGKQAQATIDNLLVSDAYNQPNHPDHARVSEQVRKHYEAIAALAEKAGGNPIM